MVFCNGTEALLRKLNRVPTLTWELLDVGVRFEANYIQVLTALLESIKQLNSVGLLTVKDFLEYVGDGIPYRFTIEADETYLETIGWIDECFSECGMPQILEPVIDAVSETSSNGHSEVIFNISFHKPPCSGCLDCLKDSHSVCYN